MVTVLAESMRGVGGCDRVAIGRERVGAEAVRAPRCATSIPDQRGVGPDTGGVGFAAGAGVGTGSAAGTAGLDATGLAAADDGSAAGFATGTRGRPWTFAIAASRSAKAGEAAILAGASASAWARRSRSLRYQWPSMRSTRT